MNGTFPERVVTALREVKGLDGPASSTVDNGTLHEISTSVGASKTSSPTTQGSTSPTASSQKSESSSNNSTTKLGVGLGVPLGVTAALLLAFLFRYRTRRWARKAQVGSNGHTVDGYNDINRDRLLNPQVTEIDGLPRENGSTRHELEENSRHPYPRELEGSPGVKRHELAAKNSNRR